MYSFLICIIALIASYYIYGKYIEKIAGPLQMAAVALVSLPLFLVFVFLRKYIMKGVSRSGIKG